MTITPITTDPASVLDALEGDVHQLARQLAELRDHLARLRNEIEHADHDRQPRRLLTVQEAAERLNMGVTAVYALLRTNQLQGVKIGKARRIPVEAVEEFVGRLVATGGEVAL